MKFLIKYVIYVLSFVVLFGSFGIAGDIKSTFVETLSGILNIISILLSPLIIIAGWALSNDFVTGKIFGIDKFLWFFWQVMKNISFFIIGFLFIFSILGYFFNLGGDKFHPKKILPKILIAILLVSGSWWLLSVLLDLSTILTLSLGTLPLKLAGNNGDQISVYKKITITKLNDTQKKDDKIPKKNITLLQTLSGQYVAPCILSGDKLVNSNIFNTFIIDLANSIKDITTGNIRNDVCYLLDVKGLRIIYSNCKEAILKCESYRDDILAKDKSLFSQIMNIHNFVGPLYYFYGSILNFNDIKNYLVGGNVGYDTIGIEFIAKLIVAIILILPLIAFAIVVIIRGFYLWFIIAFSPIIFLGRVFDFIKLKGVSDKFSVGNILALIFLPVTVVLALSLGIIFLTAINGMRVTDNGLKDEKTILQRGFDITVEEKTGSTCFILSNNGGKFCYENNGHKLGSFADDISWILVSLLGAFIMWAVVFAALKTSKLTESVVGTIESIGTGIAKTAPIIPTPWGTQSIGSMDKIMSQLQEIPGSLASQQYQRSKLNEYLDKLSADWGGEKSSFEKKVEKAKNFADLKKALSSLPRGYTLADEWNIVKSSLVNLAKKEKRDDIINSLKKITFLGQLGAYPEVYSWLKQHGIDDGILFNPNGEYNKEEIEELKEEFFKNLKDKLLEKKVVKLDNKKDGERFIFGFNKDSKLGAKIHMEGGNILLSGSQIFDLTKPQGIKSFIEDYLKYKGEKVDDKDKQFIDSLIDVLPGKSFEEKLNIIFGKEIKNTDKGVILDTIDLGGKDIVLKYDNGAIDVAIEQKQNKK